MESVSSNPETRASRQIAERQVPVTVSGRGVGAETGDAFTEQTVTTAISEKGGVIRLGAEVNEGQTIRVRNGENGREATARVLKSQTSEAGSKLAELEFVEAEPGFWISESVAADAQGAKATEASIEVPKLEAPAASFEPAPAIESPTVGQPAGQAEETPVPDWMKVNKAWEGGDGYPIRMQLPKAASEASARTAEFAADSATITAAQDEYLLPKPSLDFEQFPGLAEEKTKLFSGKARRSLSGPIGMLVVIVLVLVAAGIGSYRMGLFGQKSAKTTKPATEPSLQPTPNSEVKTMGQYPFELPAPKVETPRAEVTPEAVAGMNDESLETRTSAVTTTSEARARGSKTADAVNTKSRVGAAKADTNRLLNPAGSQDDVYEPPKLIRAVRSLSPPEALQAFVSGIVTLDALVDENGKVLSATPISGPKPLYEKAVQTVREGYVYQPATRNGKPVQAHVNARIQFWYEP